MRCSRSDARSVVSVKGEFDLSVKERVDAAIDGALEGAPAVLVIDLRELAFIDSSGIHTLVVAHRRSQQQGCALYVVRGAPQVQRILELCGLESRLMVIDAPEQAQGARPEPDLGSASGHAA